MDAKTVIDRLLLSGMTDVSQVCDVASKLSFSRVQAQQVEGRMSLHSTWSDRVKKLALIPQPAQRSEEWYTTRWNLITASDIAHALGEGKFGTQKDFLIKKCDPNSALAFNGEVPPLIWGVKYEPVANALYEYRTGQTVLEFGLLKHPSVDFIGASPDGITRHGIMLEIKCPWRRQITGEIPKQYYYQIQAQLDVCELEECDYLEVSFCEYGGEREFLEDGDALTKEGMEKGILIEYNENSRRTYEYSTIGLPVRELLEWRDSVLECRPGGRCTYWYTDVFSVVRVSRDSYFVAEMYAKAKEVWDKVLRYRANPELMKAELLESSRRATKKTATKAATVVCPLLSDEE